MLKSFTGVNNKAYGYSGSGGRISIHVRDLFQFQGQINTHGGQSQSAPGTIYTNAPYISRLEVNNDN